MVQKATFYDPRRSMAIKAWTEGDILLALRLLKWAQPKPIESFKKIKIQIQCRLSLASSLITTKLDKQQKNYIFTNRSQIGGFFRDKNNAKKEKQIDASKGFIRF